MKLRTRIIVPPLLFMLILIGLGSTQYYHDQILHDENEKAEALEEQFLDASHVISEKIEQHFKVSVRLLTEIETGSFTGNLKSESEKLEQIKINTLTYFDNLASLLNKIDASLISPIKDHEMPKTRNIIVGYFSNMTHAIDLMPNDEDQADSFILKSAETSITARANLRKITRGIERALHQMVFGQKANLSTLLSIFWWLAFFGAFVFSITFSIYSNNAGNKIQRLLDRFTKLFPEASIQSNIKDAREGVTQLEWLADNLETTKGQLNASRVQIDKLISESSNAIFVHRYLKPLFANPALVELCGYDTEIDFMRLDSTLEILPEHERERVQTIHEARLQGERAPNLYEMEVLRTDGTTRWVLNKSFVLDWVGEDAICTTLIDVTERKQAEQRLLDSEDRFQELLELTPDPIFIHTIDGKVIDVNAAACQQLGYSHEEFLKKNMQDFAPHTNKTQSQFFWKGEESKTSLIRTEQTHHIRKDGSRYPVEVNITCGLLYGQKVILAMAHDMTETMDHIKELKDLRKKAEDASKAKSEFLSMMSHELRTPLNSIIGYSDLYLQSGQAPDETAKETKWISQIKYSGEELLGVIDKVLDLITIDEEFESLIDTSTDLVMQLNTALDVQNSALQTMGLNVIKSFPENAPVHINASDKAIYMIADNLISNAIKYNTENGSIYIDIKEASPTTYELSVRDTGIGIEQKDLESVFIPFNRLGHENGPIPGNGIGLTLVQKIAEYIGADITISKPEEGGCCFSVTLPKSLII